MAASLLSSKQRSAPSLRAGYARSQSESANPHLWEGLKIAWIPTLGIQGRKLFNVVPGGPDIPFHANLADSAWQMGENGYFLRGDSSPTDNLQTIETPLQDDFGQFTIFTRARSTAWQNQVGIFGRNSLSTVGGFGIRTGNDSNEIGFFIKGFTTGIVIEYVHNPFFSNEWTSIAGHSLAPDNHILYVDGIEVNSSAVDVGSITPDTTQEWQILSRQFAEFAGDVAESMFWDRVLSPNEGMLLHQDPLAPFRLRRRYNRYREVQVGISLATIRIIPIAVELYVREQEEFLDLNVVHSDDSEYRLQFTCSNKDNVSPYAVAASDLSNVDEKEIVFTTPTGVEIIRKATFNDDGTDGIVFYVCQLNDLNIRGIWQVKVRITEGTDIINYPNVPFTVI